MIQNTLSNTDTPTSYLISIIVPTHNERENVGELYKRIDAVFSALPEAEFELIFADDSADDTPEIILAMARRDTRVKLIRLSRSFGQSVAIVVALEHASGAAAVLMDADLQDPPEAIPLLIEEWRKGFKLVYVERRSVHTSAIYVAAAFIFYRLLRFVSDTPIPADAGEFRLLDRQLVNFIVALKEHTRFMRGLSVWPGFPASKIAIKREKRLRGETNYSFGRSMIVAIDGIISFSIKPLRAAAVLGFIMSGLSLLGMAFAVGMRLYTQYWPSGATAVLSAVLLVGGVQFIFIGILGEYIGRIFVEVQRRPLYIVEYEVGFDKRNGEKDMDITRTSPPRKL